MRKIIVTAAVLLMSLSGWAAKSETIYTNYRLNNVQLIAPKAKVLAGRAIAHPATISVEKMRNMLGAVQIHRKAWLKKGKIVEDRAAFGDAAIELLAPYFVEALSKAESNQIIYFSYLAKNEKSVMRRDRLTAGKVWVEDDGFHMEFDKLFARVESDLSKRGYHDKTVAKAKGLRVVLDAGPGQMLGNSTRELIFDLGTNFTAAHAATQGGSAMSKTSVERLEELERLREMNLISEEEYTAKREAILRKL